MKASSQDSFAKTLLSELKAVREKHQQFQTRVKAADRAARARDEEARKQNAALMDKIGELEGELKQARESIEALRQFTELLPTVKSEVDSFEVEIEAFETRGLDNYVRDEAADASTRVHALGKGVDEITKLCNLSDADRSDIGSGNDFSLVGGSGFSSSSTTKPDAGSAIIPLLNLEPSPPSNSPAKPGRAAESSGSSPHKPTTFGTEASTATPPRLTYNPAPAGPSYHSPSRNPPTNRERLKLILKLTEQPLKLGDLWFLVPQTWFDEWKMICQEHPDDFNKVCQVNVSSLRNKHGTVLDHINKVSISAPAWHQLSEWYGSDNAGVPSVVMPPSPGGSLFIDMSPRIVKIYFMLPHSSAWSNTFGEHYTPQVIIPSKCSSWLLRSIVLNSLPTQHGVCSIELFSSPPSVVGQGWYISYTSGLETVSPESEPDKVVSIRRGSSLIVSVNALDGKQGHVGPINPFPSPASPPRFLTWSPSCG